MTRRLAAFCVMGAATLTTLAGCGQEDPVGVTVLLVGNHANAPAPSLSEPVRRALSQAGDRGDTLLLVTVEGTPSVAGQLPLGCPPEQQSPAACQEYQAGVQRKVAEILTKFPAKTPETSLFEAVRLGAGQAPNYVKNGGTTHIVGVDPGLDTTGLLAVPDLSTLDVDPKVLAKGFKPKLPNLSGVSVELFGIGHSAAPQTLDEEQSGKLVAIWTSVLTEAGAKSPKVVDEGNGTDPAAAGLPTVRVVEAPPGPPPGACATWVFNEAQLGFLPDQATFRDEQSAKGLVRTFANRVRAASFPISVIGTTAYPETKRGADRLSLRRAKAVMTLLAAEGIPQRRLVPQGVGTDFEDYLNPKGNPLIEIAMRRVILKPICA